VFPLDSIVEDPKLITHVTIFELVQPMPTIPQHHRQTDGRTTYDSNTALALRASRDEELLLGYLPALLSCSL